MTVKDGSINRLYTPVNRSGVVLRILKSKLAKDTLVCLESGMSNLRPWRKYSHW